MAQLSNNEVQIESTVKNDNLCEQINSAVDNSFFYTSDKFLNSLDSNDILQQLIMQYPMMNVNNNDSDIKKGILQLLHNYEFVNSILEYYHFSIVDFIKFLTGYYGSLFKGVFLTKVKNEIIKYGRKYKKRVSISRKKPIKHKRKRTRSRI